MSIAEQAAYSGAPGGRNRFAFLVRTVSRWWRSYTTWRNRQLAAAALQRLDDRMLRDIGLGRTEINSVVHTGGRGRRLKYRGQ